MAKIKYGVHVEESYFDNLQELKITKKGAVATWSYEEGGTVLLTGTGLKEGADESLTAGTVKTVTYYDPDGDAIVTITGLNLKATKLMHAYEQGGQLGLQFAMLTGNDTFIGSKHDDYMDGSKGNDTFIGKGGEDTFSFDFSGKAQHDVIADFSLEMDSLDLHQDILSTKSVHKGEDTLIRFEGGSDILLNGIEKADFDEWHVGATI